MAEYIERKAALLSVMRAGCMANTVQLLKDIPAADVAPVRHGEWKNLGGDEWCCTACGHVISTEGRWEKPNKKYCEECGAKMDGGADNAR